MHPEVKAALHCILSDEKELSTTPLEYGGPEVKKPSPPRKAPSKAWVQTKQGEQATKVYMFGLERRCLCWLVFCVWQATMLQEARAENIEQQTKLGRGERREARAERRGCL